VIKDGLGGETRRGILDGAGAGDAEGLGVVGVGVGVGDAGEGLLFDVAGDVGSEETLGRGGGKGNLELEGARGDMSFETLSPSGWRWGSRTTGVTGAVRGDVEVDIAAVAIVLAMIVSTETCE
jgi:hypothetical protein